MKRLKRLLGIFLIILGLVFYGMDPLQLFIDYHSQLSPSSILTQLWKGKLNVFLTMDLYIFNYTNLNDFLKNGTKLKVEELGPYVYENVLYNNDVEFNENETVTYRRDIVWKYHPDLSISDITKDTIVFPNYIFLGVATKFAQYGIIPSFALAQLSNTLNIPAFFKNETIHKVLFNYTDNLIWLANTILPNWIDFNATGIMDRMIFAENEKKSLTTRMEENLVSKSIHQMETMAENAFNVIKFYESPYESKWIKKVKNADQLTKNCFGLESLFLENPLPRNTKSLKQFNILRPSLCKPLKFIHINNSILSTYPVANYIIDPNSFASVEQNPNNKCFCYRQNKCAPTGLFFVHPCYYDMPVVLSKPHFLDADERILAKIDGLNPNPKTHDTLISLLENFGIPIKVDVKIQANMFVDTKSNLKTKPFNNHILPLIWVHVRLRAFDTLIYAIFTFINAMPILKMFVPSCLITTGVYLVWPLIRILITKALCSQEVNLFNETTENPVTFISLTQRTLFSERV